jgi:RNA polymerase sigma-70 factor (ECF subfamily)
MDKSDKEIIVEFLNGNEECFNIIARKYQKIIYWHARRMLGVHDDADELTQEVLIVLYHKLSTFRFDSSLTTWIYRITSNRAKNYLKKKSVKQFFSIGKNDENTFQSSQDIIKNYEEKEKIDTVIKMLRKLPVKQREVFIFRNFEELSYNEISEITGKSVGALKANYFHALKKVLEMVNE